MCVYVCVCVCGCVRININLLIYINRNAPAYTQRQNVYKQLNVKTILFLKNQFKVTTVSK